MGPVEFKSKKTQSALKSRHNYELHGNPKSSTGQQ